MNPGYLAVDGAHLTPRELDDLMAYTASRPGSVIEFDTNQPENRVQP